VVGVISADTVQAVFSHGEKANPIADAIMPLNPALGN